MADSPCYSPRLDEALALVAEAFRSIPRKGSKVPYLTHLLAVMATVGEFGGNEDQMIAALLHDYIEDIEGSSEAALSERFGAVVASYVRALSDTVSRPKPPWEERKRAYIAKLGDEPAAVKLISAADKLHNASSIVRDHRAIGEAIFDRFTATKSQTLWYYRELVHALGDGWDHPILAELTAKVRELHVCAGIEYESKPARRT